MKATKSILTWIIGILFLTMTACTTQVESKVTSSSREPAAQTAVSSNSMEVHFLDVGQADCILIKTPDAAMLVDAGKNEDGVNVVSYIQQQGITKLDYVIGTHPHEDHIGGLDDVIRSFDIGEVILPGKTHTSQTYMDVLKTVQEKGLQITQAEAGQEYRLGDAEFKILSPKKGVDYGDNLNNWSVGIKLVNGNNSLVMTGDAESVTEKDILTTGIDLKADAWKAGHHGSNTSNTDELLQAINPKYTVISCGANNQYGHPDLEILQRFEAQNIDIFRSDEQGTIIAVSDGNNITWNVKASNTMAPGEKRTDQTNEDAETVNQAQDQEIEQQPFQEDPDQEDPDQLETGQDQEKGSDILQTMVHITEAGGKYHNAGCQYLKNSDIEVTLTEAQDRGLEPCSKCNPPQ